MCRSNSSFKQGLTSLKELRLDHALNENFTTIDPAIWNGLDSITDLHLDNARGIRIIPTGAFSAICDTLQVNVGMCNMTNGRIPGEHLIYKCSGFTKN